MKTFNEFKAYLESLNPDDGATFENGKPITRRNGYQVASTRNHFTDINEAAFWCVKLGGSFGVWVDPNTGAYCVDATHYIQNKTVAILAGIFWRQESIFDWASGSCIEIWSRFRK